MWPWRSGCFCAMMLCILAGLVGLGRSNLYPTPPLPLGPIPSASQLAFQEREMAMFFHFGMNTFTDSEWGTGADDPILFNPTELNTDQWISVAKAAGFRLVILTVKHHDGFCLWQTKYTNYSVASSPWKDGSGDVLRDFVTSANKAGLKVGIYLSPWDRHDESYGDSLGYNEHYLAQIREILTKHGTISEVWLDGAKGEDAVDMNYLFEDWFDVIKQLQPSANIFSDSGPDVRWVGNEYGSAGSTCWGMMNRSAVAIGHSGDALDYLNMGDPYGTDWVPAECDVSIRPGWFWHASEEPWPLESLIQLYFTSVGRNSVLLLNVPPNSSGLISEEDTKVLLQFRTAMDTIFCVNLARGASVTASSTRGEKNVGSSNSPFAPSQVLDEHLETFWTPEEGVIESYLELELTAVVSFNVLKVQEEISLGQRVSGYSFYIWADESWQLVTKGTTIGFKRLSRVPLVQAQRVRLQIDSARGPPIISSIGLYYDEVSVAHPKILSAQNIRRYYFKERDFLHEEEQQMQTLKTVIDGFSEAI
ncbi:unnamed protein product [Calypogeia fissa]